MAKTWHSILTMMRAGLLLLVIAGCSKDSPKGMPPASDWKGSGETGGMVQTNPHAGMGGTRGTPGDPHAGMGGGMGGPAAGGGANPHAGGGPGMGGGGGEMPTKTAPHTLEKVDGRSVLGPFTLVAPKEWTEKGVTSSMRVAQFDLGDESELVIYYFGEGGAGSIEANLDRWLAQFTQPDGKQTKDVAKIEKTKFADQEATVVSVTGRYTTSMMPGGPPPVDKQDQMLLGAIVGSPKGPYYFKLVGSKKNVEANQPRFKAMLASMKLKV